MTQRFHMLTVASLYLLLASATALSIHGPWNMPAASIFVRGGEQDQTDGTATSTQDTLAEKPQEEPAVPVVSGIPRGGSDYAMQLEKVKSDVIEKASASIRELERAIVDEGSVVAGFGQKADTICNEALQEFAQQAPSMADDDPTAAAAYDRKLEELEAAVDSPLEVLYLRQLALLREQALQGYRSATRTSGSSDYEAMLVADGKFARDAQEATREGSDWDFAMERTHLQQVMNNIAASSKRAMDVEMKSAQQSQTAMQFLQQQQQMIQQLQMQLYGQTSPWNMGVAYRIPDTNFNLQGSYQQGRANIQLSCVPDEYAPMLGPNGFTNGVGPGNLGLSLNLSV